MVFNTSTEARWDYFIFQRVTPSGRLPPGRRRPMTVRGPAGHAELPYDALLLGTGRKAKVDDLNLEAAGVRLGKDRVPGRRVSAYRATRTIFAAATWHSLKNSPRGYGQRRGYASPRVDEPIAQQGNLSFRIAPIDPKWLLKWAWTPRRAGKRCPDRCLSARAGQGGTRPFSTVRRRGSRRSYTRRAVVRFVGATLVAAHAR